MTKRCGECGKFAKHTFMVWGPALASGPDHEACDRCIIKRGQGERLTPIKKMAFELAEKSRQNDFLEAQLETVTIELNKALDALFREKRYRLEFDSRTVRIPYEEEVKEITFPVYGTLNDEMIAIVAQCYGVPESAVSKPVVKKRGGRTFYTWRWIEE